MEERFYLPSLAALAVSLGIAFFAALAVVGMREKEREEPAWQEFIKTMVIVFTFMLAISIMAAGNGQ